VTDYTLYDQSFDFCTHIYEGILARMDR